MTKVIQIYTDGACSGNPGPGGWAAILLYDNTHKEVYGFEANTTNNRMELLGAINGLGEVPSISKEPIAVEIYTDSKYLKDGITLWIKKWHQNNWNKGAVKNIDLWKQLDALDEKYHTKWFWIKAHNGHEYNERVDALARKAIYEYKNKNILA